MTTERIYPKGFVGHASFAREFSRLQDLGKIPHGIILKGSKGIGKARVAQCLAQALFLGTPELLGASLEESRLSPEQQKIRSLLNSGAYANLKIISKGSGAQSEKQGTSRAISIEEIKSIGDFFSLKSHDDNWRIAIVDSVDDLSPKGANAFLKILEEPPEKSLIILISHSMGSLLPTIRSRCQLFALDPLSEPETKAVLETAAQESSNEALDAETLEELLAFARGRPGLALMLLNFGGMAFLSVLESALKKAQRQDFSELLMVTEMLFSNSSFENDDVTFEAFMAFLFEYMAEHFIRVRKQDEGSQGVSSEFVKSWFSCITQAQETLVYSLDKKASCLSIMHQLTSPGNSNTW